MTQLYSQGRTSFFNDFIIRPPAASVPWQLIKNQLRHAKVFELSLYRQNQSFNFLGSQRPIIPRNFFACREQAELAGQNQQRLMQTLALLPHKSNAAAQISFKRRKSRGRSSFSLGTCRAEIFHLLNGVAGSQDPRLRVRRKANMRIIILRCRRC